MCVLLVAKFCTHAEYKYIPQPEPAGSSHTGTRRPDPRLPRDVACEIMDQSFAHTAGQPGRAHERRRVVRRRPAPGHVHGHARVALRERPGEHALSQLRYIEGVAWRARSRPPWRAGTRGGPRARSSWRERRRAAPSTRPWPCRSPRRRAARLCVIQLSSSILPHFASCNGSLLLRTFLLRGGVKKHRG